MKKYIPILIAAIAFQSAVIVVFTFYQSDTPLKIASFLSNEEAASAAIFPSPFHYTFNTTEVLNERGSMEESPSPYWWLNSGGQLLMASSTGGTLQGELPLLSTWRLAYGGSNPRDTDGGYHPQNIFRLVTRHGWENVREEAYFQITKDNLSDSANRNSSNGLLLFLRYKDGDNLYYAGLRVDGAAVIKKKLHGDYFTLAYEPLYAGSYERTNTPNLLPHGEWIGIRSEAQTLSNGRVRLSLFLDRDSTGKWTKVAEVIDDGKKFGSAITGEGYGGIRTDFMDVLFADYKFINLDKKTSFLKLEPRV